LEELATLLPPGLTVERHVLAGKAAPVIGQAALDLKSCLLVVAATYDDVKFLPRGLSTALSLMVSAQVPILVMDGRATTLWPDSGVRLLLADDLGPASEGAVDFAFDFSAGIRRVALHHLHVNALTRGAIEVGFNTARATSPMPSSPAAGVDEVFAA